MKRNVFLGAVLALVVGLVVPHTASAFSCSASKCGKNETRTRLERKTCPSNKKRRAIVITRACCLKSNGKTRCRHFPQCPKASPSTACL